VTETAKASPSSAPVRVSSPSKPAWSMALGPWRRSASRWDRGCAAPGPPPAARGGRVRTGASCSESSPSHRPRRGVPGRGRRPARARQRAHPHPAHSRAGLFLSVMPRRRMARDMVATLTATPWVCAHCAQCSASVASGRAATGAPSDAACSDPIRGAAGPGLRGERAGRCRLVPPAGHRAQTDAKGAGCFSLAVAGVHKSQPPLAEDSGVGLPLASLPSCQFFCNPLQGLFILGEGR
jgi:hypothetical protein